MTRRTGSSASSRTSASRMAGSSPRSRAGARSTPRGMVVFPGGVDIHTHVAGAALNFARGITPENYRKADPFLHTPELRAGLGGITPTTFATGYLYAAHGLDDGERSRRPDPVRPPHPRGAARHSHPGQGLAGADGQQRDRAGPAGGGRGRAREARGGLAHLGGQGLRGKGGQPRRHRRLEVREERERARRAGARLQQGDAGADHLRPRGHRRRPGAAASPPPPLQQPGHPGQREHHARDDEGPGGTPRAHGPSPVPRLRRRRLGHAALRSGRRSPSTSTPTRTSPRTRGRSSSATP